MEGQSTNMIDFYVCGPIIQILCFDQIGVNFLYTGDLQLTK